MKFLLLFLAPAALASEYSWFWWQQWQHQATAGICNSSTLVVAGVGTNCLGSKSSGTSRPARSCVPADQWWGGFRSHSNTTTTIMRVHACRFQVIPFSTCLSQPWGSSDFSRFTNSWVIAPSLFSPPGLQHICNSLYLKGWKWYLLPWLDADTNVFTIWNDMWYTLMEYFLRGCEQNVCI
jgi:hypothetical protein